MKLKKIASLMLAGIMAVSMLAGCKSGTPNPNPGEGEGEGNTATGYSVALGDALADTLKDAKIDDIVTFSNNADDQAALEDALGNLGRKQLWYTDSFDAFGDLEDAEAVADFKKAAKLDRETLINTAGDIYDYEYNINKTVKVGDIFYIDSNVEMSKVINQIVAEYGDEFAELKDSLKVVDEDGKELVYDFNYTVSVSVVNVPSPDVTIFTGSTNFIAVTVTRTVA